MTAAGDPRFWLRLAALVLLAASLVAPALRTRRVVYDAIVVMDITDSMNTRDVTLDGVAASRLALEKQAASRLLASLPCGSRLGLAVFVEKVPALLVEPVESCENFAPLEAEIDALDWRMGWDSESHIAEALQASMRMAGRLRADVLFMTDGQESPPLWWNGMPNFGPLRGAVHGAILGVGGHVLVPIPKYDTNGNQIGYFKPDDIPSDPDGMFAGHGNLTAVDEPHLRRLSSLSGLAYAHLDGADDLMAVLERTARKRLQPGRVETRWICAALALVLLAAAAAPWPAGRGRRRGLRPSTPPRAGGPLDPRILSQGGG